MEKFIRGRALQFFESKLNLKLNQDTEFSHFHTKHIFALGQQCFLAIAVVAN